MVKSELSSHYYEGKFYLHNHFFRSLNLLSQCKRIITVNVTDFTLLTGSVKGLYLYGEVIFFNLFHDPKPATNLFV